MLKAKSVYKLKTIYNVIFMYLNILKESFDSVLCFYLYRWREMMLHPTTDSHLLPLISGGFGHLFCYLCINHVQWDFGRNSDSLLLYIYRESEDDIYYLIVLFFSDNKVSGVSLYSLLKWLWLLAQISQSLQIQRWPLVGEY